MTGGRMITAAHQYQHQRQLRDTTHESRGLVRYVAAFSSFFIAHFCLRFRVCNDNMPQFAQVLRSRFPVSSGNLAVHTHATTSFSIAYGICHGWAEHGEEAGAHLQRFLKELGPIGPAVRCIRSLKRTEKRLPLACRCVAAPLDGLV